jgi:hypothetical protein
MSDPAMTPSSLTCPHPALSPIVGTPSNASIQILQQKQLHANARAIHSTRGGGLNGHLTLVMPASNHLVRAGVAFDVPVHPGDSPVHAPAATAPQIAEANPRFKHGLSEHRLFCIVAEEIKQQVLLADPNRCFCVLEDVNHGCSDVSVLAILLHLKATYATIQPEEIETNRAQLTATWNPEDPIEELWQRIQEIQRFAAAAQKVIADAATLRLTLGVFEATRVFITATEKWRDKDQADWAVLIFQDHFTHADKERIRILTAQAAGHHGAHSAVVAPPAGANSATVTPPPATGTAAPPATGTLCCCCWTHGLGKNNKHTSAQCNNKTDGCKDNATAANMMGGNNKLMSRRCRDTQT